MPSQLIFQSSLGPWSVVTCACGCGDACIIWDTQVAESPGAPRFYVRNHQPLGCDASRIGEPWDYEYDEMRDFERPIAPQARFEEEETPVIEWETDTSGRDGMEFGDPRSFFDDDLYDTKP